MFSFHRESVRSSFLVLWLVAAAAVVHAGQEPDRSYPPIIFDPDITLTVQTYALNPYEPKLDGQWAGSIVASDGKTYFASSSHAYDTAAMLFQYNPANTGINVLVPDLSLAVGENAKTMVPQGKLHSNIVEHDGWLYFGTHLANYWASAQTNYTGGHMVRYQLGSQEAGTPVVQDLGILRDNYTNYWGVSVDPVNNHVYGWATRWWGATSDSYLYRMDLDGSNKTQIGGAFASGTNMAQFVDSQGDMWFNHSGTNNVMYKVDGDTGQVSSYASPVGTLGWAEQIDADKFVVTAGTTIYEFDASKARDGNLNDAFTVIRTIGTGGLSMVLSGRDVFFIDSPNPDVIYTKAADHHLYSISLDDPSELIDWGRIVDQDGRTPWRIESLAADAFGNISMTGDWRLLTDEFGNLLESGTVRHDDSNPGNFWYDDMWRGQFFATVSTQPQIPEPITGSMLALGIALALTARKRRRQA